MFSKDLIASFNKTARSSKRNSGRGPKNAFRAMEALEAREFMSMTPVTSTVPASTSSTTTHIMAAAASSTPVFQETIGTLSQSVAASASATVLHDNAYFVPLPPLPCYIRIGGEIMQLTADDTSGLTVHRAVNGVLQTHNVGDNIDFVLYTPTTQPPPPPVVSLTLHGVAVSPSQVNLTWNAVPGATSYRLEQLRNGVWYYRDVTGTSFSVTGLGAASTNSFRIAVNNGQNKFTTPISVLTFPASPTNVKAQATSSTHINLTWDAVAGVSQYVIHYRIDQGAWQDLNPLSAGQTSDSLTVTAGHTYTFEVGARNAAGISNSSAVTVVAQAATTLSRPATVTITPESSTVVLLNWTAVAGATSYNISLYQNNGFQNFTSTANTSIYLNISGLTHGATYKFGVCAANSAGQAPTLTYVTFTVP